ncbi:MAG: NAD(P)-dependent oxidoreductase [Cyclobacteriaceae bacterium]
MSEPVGIIGLGRIGLTAAKAFINAGHKIFGYDVNPDSIKELASAGGTAVRSPAEIAMHAEVMIVLVLNDIQVTEVISGSDGILTGSGPRSIIICMSTINQHTLESVAQQCKERNAGFIDCPFTGGQARIASQSLTLIAAAPDEQIRRVRHILEVIGKIVHAGNKPGQGQAIKHCNQLLVGVTHAATMEVIALAKKLGLDPSLVTSVVASGIAGSDYFRLLSESVLKKTPSPGGLGQMCKDMSIVEKTLANARMKAAVASAASDYFSAALQMGMSEREGAALMEVVEKFANKNVRDSGKQ